MLLYIIIIIIIISSSSSSIIVVVVAQVRAAEDHAILSFEGLKILTTCPDPVGTQC